MTIAPSSDFVAIEKVVVNGNIVTCKWLREEVKDSVLERLAGEVEPLNQVTIAWVGSVLIGSYFFAGPLVSALANKFGFRTVAVIGSVTTAAAFISASLLNQNGPDVASLIIFYGIFGGIGFSCIYMAAVVVVGLYFEKKRALATGMAVCGSGVGNFLFPPLIVLLADRFQWQGAIMGLGIIVLLCALLGLLYKPLKPPRAPEERIGGFEEAPPEEKAVCCRIVNVVLCGKRKTFAVPDKGAMSVTSCFQEAGKKVAKFVDFSLWKSPTLILLGVSSMFTMLGMLVPFVYLMDQARYALAAEITLSDKKHQTLLISIIGAANTVGRIIAGWIADRPGVNALTLNNGAVLLMGSVTVVVPLLQNYYLFVVYSGVFGLAMAAFVSLRSILIVQLLGLAKLTDAYGFVLLFEGVGATLATPLAAILVRLTSNTAGKGDFSIAFYFAGGSLLLSAFLYYQLTWVHRWEVKRQSGDS